MSRLLVSVKPTKSALQNATASNAQFKPTARPVALIFGGTSGIGQAMAERLALQTEGKAQIVLLGRNQEAANKIIASFPHTPTGTPSDQESKYSFVKIDATSMANVREVTSRLSRELEKINFIVASPGYLTLKGRDETEEGIDRKLACNFYARFRFIADLAPLVEKAAEKGERTGVMSVLGAGHGGAVDLNDMGLVKTFTLARAADHAISYTDAVFEELSVLHPKIPFIHASPGGVLTQGATDIPLAWLLVPLARPFLTTPEQCAQMMWWRMWSTDEEWKAGPHQMDNQAEEVEHNKFVTPEVRKAVWEHAVKMTSGPSTST